MYPEITFISGESAYIGSIIIFFFTILFVLACYDSYIKRKYTIYISIKKYRKLSAKDKLNYRIIKCCMCDEYLLPKEYYYNPRYHSKIEHVCPRRECQMLSTD